MIWCEPEEPCCVGFVKCLANVFEQKLVSMGSTIRGVLWEARNTGDIVLSLGEFVYRVSCIAPCFTVYVLMLAGTLTGFG